jgi:hypothetical protein
LKHRGHDISLYQHLSGVPFQGSMIVRAFVLLALVSGCASNTVPDPVGTGGGGGSEVAGGSGSTGTAGGGMGAAGADGGGPSNDGGLGGGGGNIAGSGGKGAAGSGGTSAAGSGGESVAASGGRRAGPVTAPQEWAAAVGRPAAQAARAAQAG